MVVSDEEHTKSLECREPGLGSARSRRNGGYIFWTPLGRKNTKLSPLHTARLVRGPVVIFLFAYFTAPRCVVPSFLLFCIIVFLRAGI